MSGLCRRIARCLAIAATCLVVVPRAVGAPGFPSFDELRESLIAGRVQPNAPWRSTLASSRGVWREGPLGLHVESGAGERWWIPKDAPATVEDGIVRFRVVPGDRPEFGLLFRVEEDAQGATLSGYELQVAGRELSLRRWDRGLVRAVGPSASLRRRLPQAPLEVVLFLMGPQITALVYDGESLDQLATLSAYETTYAVGRVGLRIGESAAQGTTLTLLSTMTTTAAHLVPPPNKQGPLYGPARGPGTTPLGPERYVWIAAGDLSFVPRDLQARSLGPTPLPLPVSSSKAADTVLLHLDTLGLERLRRAGIDPLAIDGDVPWKAVDPELRAALALAPPVFAPGMRYPEHYKDPAMVEAVLRAFHEEFPQLTTLVDLGRTHLGRTVWALKISDFPFDDDGEPRVLLSAGTRGDHLLSVEIALDAVRSLLTSYGRDARRTTWVDELEIFVLPLLNPDGAAMFIHETRSAGRKNGRDSNHDGVHDPYEGVNIALNFPGVAQTPRHPADPDHAGPHGGSEPETEAFMELAREQRFVAALTISGASARKPTICQGAASPVSEGFVAALTAASSFGGDCSAASTDGAAAWIARAWGAAAVSMAGLDSTPTKRDREQALDAARPVWEAFLGHVASRPRVFGTVRNAAGSPIEAAIEIEGEAWPSDPDQGTFDRLLARPGHITLRASANGYLPEQVELDIGAAPARIELTLVDAGTQHEGRDTGQ